MGRYTAWLFGSYNGTHSTCFHQVGPDPEEEIQVRTGFRARRDYAIRERTSRIGVETTGWARSSRFPTYEVTDTFDSLIYYCVVDANRT